MTLYRKNIVGSSVLFVVFLVFYVKSFALKGEAADWPGLVSLCGMIFSLAEVAKELWKLKKEGKENDSPVITLNRKQLGHLGYMLGVILIWYVLMRWFGFLPLAMLALTAIFIFFDHEKSKRSVLIDVALAVIVSLVIYLIFVLLGVRLPSAKLFG